MISLFHLDQYNYFFSHRFRKTHIINNYLQVGEILSYESKRIFQRFKVLVIGAHKNHWFRILNINITHKVIDFNFKIS